MAIEFITNSISATISRARCYVELLTLAKFERAELSSSFVALVVAVVQGRPKQRNSIEMWKWQVRAIRRMNLVH